MEEKNIKLFNVTKEYGGGSFYKKCAIKDINLTICQGEYIGIAGINGSGKTTLARLLNGLIVPTRGQVFVNGMDTTNKHFIKEIRHLVGIVFQNPDNQIVSPIVEEEIAFGPENLNFSPREVKKRVDWALEVVGLEDYRYHVPHLLSGGQKQRVAIASVLAMMPSYLILDEPTSMLDTEGTRELMHCLKKINRVYGITIILISHFMEDFIDAERLIVLRNGMIHINDTPWHVFNSDKNLDGTGLRRPDLVRLVVNLRKRGHRIDENIMTVEQMVRFLCP
jgi:energy-coupling factor transport system ATP-binding protein